jgi:GAF domain-containing protein
MPAPMQMSRTRALLAKRPNVKNEEFFQALCLDTSGDLDVDQTSVWTFAPDLSRIDCHCCYDALAETFSSGQSLRQQDCPRYFREVVEESFVCADNVAEHLATREFLDTYFKPNGIVSLLDFVLHHDRDPFGIICCENRREPRTWQESDRAYLRSLATLTSFLFLPSSRR